MNLKNRLVIYFFYDGEGIVDDYNLVMLRDMMDNCKDLFVVSNGKLSDTGRKKFEELTDQILERENKGFDVGAYKEALTHIGWDKLEEYEEIILMNYTIMGPVYPFKEMFDAMDARDLDFWGITKFHEVKFDPYGMIKCGYLREHIQSHYIAVRRNMVKSEDFRAYWEDMPEIKSYGESVALHESYFTHHFEKRGFKWDVYVNTDDMKRFTEFPLLKAPKKLLKEKRCPIFKRRSFNHDYLDFINTTIGEATYELMEYLKNETTYDVDLIWENILRCCNQAKIKESMQLNYILPSNQSKDISNILKNKKIALVLHLYYEDLLEESFQYAYSMPPEADIYVTVGSDEMKKKSEEYCAKMPNHCEVIKTPNRGRDVGPVLVAVNPKILEYDIACFAHDKKVSQLIPECKGAAWAYQCFESVLKNKHYVNNVISTFDENPRLGLLTPAPPIHAEYFPTVGNEWGANYENAKKLAKELGINVPMTNTCPPISPLGDFFWCRPKALKKLYDRNYSYDEFPEEPMKETDGSILHAIERLFSFVVQDAGYYPAWGFSDSIASMEITNLYYMLREMSLAVGTGGIGGTFVDVIGELGRRGPAMRSLAELHQALKGIYGETPTSKNELSTIMNLYYSEGEGYSQKNSEMCRANFRKNKFEVEFEIPDNEKCIESLRFDPGEAGMIVLEKLKGIIEYTDDTQEIIMMNQCTSNGYPFENKILFIGDDPQIFIRCAKGKRVRSVVFMGGLEKNISQDTVQKAFDQKIPQMTPKIYYDCGTGISEENSMHVMNLGDSRKIETEFIFEDSKKLNEIRFDPCEEGMFVLENLEMSIQYVDGSNEKKYVEDSTTNGYTLVNRICFLGEDPQITWKCNNSKEVEKIHITAKINQNFSKQMIIETMQENQTSSVLNKKFWKR